MEADERCGGRGGGDRRRSRWSWRREVEERGGVGGERRKRLFLQWKLFQSTQQARVMGGTMEETRNIDH